MKNSEQSNDHRPRRRKIPFLVRATFAGIAIALTSLWALSVSYDISREELTGFLLGSILLLLGVLVAAALLVTCIKALAMLLGRFKKNSPDPWQD